MQSKKKGTLFWIEGYSGSGKTSVANLMHDEITKKFGKTIIINGDDLRNIFGLHNYSEKGRFETFKKYAKLAKFITNQNINLIFTVVGLKKYQRKWLKNNIQNFIGILIKTNISDIIKFNKKKKIYKKKKNIVGVDIEADIPRNTEVVVNNDFKISLKKIKNKIIKKISLL